MARGPENYTGTSRIVFKSDSADLIVPRYYQPNPQADHCMPLPQLASLTGAPPPSAPPSSPSKRNTPAGAAYAYACKASSDTALTAFAQLVAIKMDADRAIIR